WVEVRRHTMKRTCQLVCLLAAMACTAVSCGPEHADVNRPHCAFADPEFTTSLGICNLVAEYYVAHGEWPLTKAQLQEQHMLLLEKEKSRLPAEDYQEASAFLDRFTLLNLRKSGEDLVFHYRFKMDRKKID